MPSDRCRSVCLSCPVCDVGVLWPNGWTDQDEPYHAGRPRPWPNRVTWGPSSPSPRERGTAVPPPVFSAHVYCGCGRPSQLLLSSCYHMQVRFCFSSARRIASAVLTTAIPSVCLSVRHTLVLCQNDGT